MNKTLLMQVLSDDGNAFESKTVRQKVWWDFSFLAMLKREIENGDQYKVIGDIYSNKEPNAL